MWLVLIMLAVVVESVMVVASIVVLVEWLKKAAWSSGGNGFASWVGCEALGEGDVGGRASLRPGNRRVSRRLIPCKSLPARALP